MRANVYWYTFCGCFETYSNWTTKFMLTNLIKLQFSGFDISQIMFQMLKCGRMARMDFYAINENAFSSE